MEHPPNGHSHGLWPVRRHGNVGDICFGRAASGLHSGICGIVRLGFDIWIPSRRLAIWPRRSDLGVVRRAPLVAKGILTPALGLIFQNPGLWVFVREAGDRRATRCRGALAESGSISVQ